MRKSWLVVCVTNFLIAALMGLLMRLSTVIPQKFEYSNWMHAHSHTAMLGWVYMMIYCLVVHHFIPSGKQKNYNTLFWLTQITVVGMMISFPLQGYALFSIIFSTSHILCSYAFCYKILKDSNVAFCPAKRFLYTSLVFLLLSTLGAWMLGVIGSPIGKNSDLYKSSIQFFLHFQFNGWFIFAILSIFFSVVNKYGVYLKDSFLRFFYYYLTISTILTFALPVSWYFTWTPLFYIHWAGVAMQVIALIYFIKMMQEKWQKFNEEFSKSAKWLLMLSLVSLIIKTAMQIAAMLPEVATASYTVRDFTIGFIHLVMLGVVNGFLFFLLAELKVIGSKEIWKKGILIFYIGFLATELILFIQGIGNFLKIPPFPEFPMILFAASVLLPTGLILILISLLARKPR